DVGGRWRRDGHRLRLEAERLAHTNRYRLCQSCGRAIGGIRLGRYQDEVASRQTTQRREGERRTALDRRALRRDMLREGAAEFPIQLLKGRIRKRLLVRQDDHEDVRGLSRGLLLRKQQGVGHLRVQASPKVPAFERRNPCARPSPCDSKPAAMLILGIETSCDETAAAVVRGKQVLADVVQ